AATAYGALQWGATRSRPRRDPRASTVQGDAGRRRGASRRSRLQPSKHLRPPMNDTTPRYAGPKALAESLSAFFRASGSTAPWKREGLREDSEYRDLGLAAATGGRISAKHIRALKPMMVPTGWHWHDMTAHYVYVLRGSLTFRVAGVVGEGPLTAGAG